MGFAHHHMSFGHHVGFAVAAPRPTSRACIPTSPLLTIYVVHIIEVVTKLEELTTSSDKQGSYSSLAIIHTLRGV